MAPSTLEDLQKDLAVQQEVIKSELFRLDEKLVRMIDLQTEAVSHIATLAEKAKEGSWLNRMLVLGLLVLAGAEKVIGWLGAAA